MFLVTKQGALPKSSIAQRLKPISDNWSFKDRMDELLIVKLASIALGGNMHSPLAYLSLLLWPADSNEHAILHLYQERCPNRCTARYTISPHLR
ncbi:hypothetical protein TNCV_2151401 [Trichonephila clavipes]|uniref:Uncharacterized protein n=1 Tax=Trichonephila clavipes TaxID=2585209 RepID=A0A8X6R2D1_TRICX|nr:hypothetical protein TNCV_2151401 [Trichonephila clavipes]